MLGDTVANITKKIGVKPCIPCQARQQKMNNWHAQLTATLQKLKAGFSRGSSS